MKAKIVYMALALVLVFSLAAVVVPAGPALAAGATIEVSQPAALTSNGEYDRNPSIINDGSSYWLFYTKGDDTSTSGVRGSYNPDADTYVVYYKKAGTIAGLASAAEAKLALSESARPANFDQRVVSATYFNSKVYAFVSSGQSGTDRGLYYYEYSGGSWSGPATLIADGTARGGHVNVVSDASRVYIVWESSDGSSDCYTWNGVVLSPKIDISSDNQPKITLMGTTLYVVSIEDTTTDIEMYSAAVGASPSFSWHSTAISAAGFYDPCIFNDGTDLYVVTAPCDGGDDQQWMVQTSYSGGSWATVKTVSYGGYGGTYWWEYWPIGYYDGSDLYLFFTTETSSPMYSDGEIACIEMDWNLANDHYFYIQNAVDQASSGETINVAAGTYHENVNIYKSLTLQAGLKPTIDGDTTLDGVPDGSCITIGADGVTVDGFELTNGYNGIIGETDNSVIKNNEIHDNLNYVGSNGVGILLWGDNDNNQILDNEIYSNDRQGIFIGYEDDSKISTGNTISGNEVYDNGQYTQPNGPDASAYGIQLWNADGNTIQNNGVYGHDDWFASPDFDFAQGIYLYASFDNTVTGNDLEDNNYGVGALSMGRDPIGSNDVNFNNIIGNTGYGVRSFDTAIDATNNYWGDVSGPEDTTGSTDCMPPSEGGWNCDACDLNADGGGDNVSDNVDYCPWLGEPYVAPTPTPTPTQTPTPTPTLTLTPTPTGPEVKCFIATAAYGTEAAAEIDTLRAFRDEVLVESALGSQLVEWYYQTSPPVADFIAENAVLKTLVRELVIDPMVSVATFTQGIWGK